MCDHILFFRLDGSVEWVPRDEVQHKWPKLSQAGYSDPTASYSYWTWY